MKLTAIYYSSYSEIVPKLQKLIHSSQPLFHKLNFFQKCVCLKSLMQPQMNLRINEKVIEWLKTISRNAQSVKERFCSPFRYRRRKLLKSTVIGYAQTVDSALEHMIQADTISLMIFMWKSSQKSSRE